jgi:hypothetical protein
MASELRVNTITSTTGVGTVTLGSGGVSFSGTPTFNDVTLSSINGNAISGTRNRIINGDMRIDQRNAGAAVTAETYIVDRWRTWRDQTYSIQQVTDAPVGFSNSLQVTKTSTTQSTYAGLVQYIEGFNASDLGFGTANATTITLSFWVKSSVTGIFTVAISNAAENRWYGATYTISAANTWEKKSVTVAGDTTGTWVGSTNGIGLQLWFNYGQAATAQAAGVWAASGNARATAGSTNLGTTNGATFLITGVQLEPGTVATPFERRSYGQELALCHRYFQRRDFTANGWITSASKSIGNISFGTPFRANPTTFTFNSGSIAYGPGGTQSISSMDAPGASSADYMEAGFNNTGGMTTNAGSSIRANISVSAEL